VVVEFQVYRRRPRLPQRAKRARAARLYFAAGSLFSNEKPAVSHGSLTLVSHYVRTTRNRANASTFFTHSELSSKPFFPNHFQADFLHIKTRTKSPGFAFPQAQPIEIESELSSAPTARNILAQGNALGPQPPIN
jgi:hypothetical protein